MNRRSRGEEGSSPAEGRSRTDDARTRALAVRRRGHGSAAVPEVRLALALLSPFGALPLAGAERGAFVFEPQKPIIPAPLEPALWPEYRRQLAEWRRTTRQQLAYDDRLYRRKDFAWVTSDFSCCFLMMCDQAFYDPARRQYTVERFLDHGQKEFGGYDSVVLWHAYPRIGTDDRNQFDFYRDMPGALAGLRKVSQRFHRRGVRVFIDYNPWDTGTRRENRADLDALAELVQAIEADGIFLDTMSKGAAAFRGRLDAARPGVVIEGEIELPVENIHDHHMSWAQWFSDSTAPGVLRNKWFERRHLQHQIKRWTMITRANCTPHGRTAAHYDMGKRLRPMGRLEPARPLSMPADAPYPAPVRLRLLRGRLDASGHHHSTKRLCQSLGTGRTPAVDDC